MIKKVAFSMYPVQDMIRAQHFYEQILGLERGKVSAGGKWVEYDLPGGGCLALTSMVEGVAPSAVAGGSVAFEVDEIEALVANLKQKKVVFKMDLFPTPVCNIAVALDSEGNAFMLHQLKK